MKGYCCECRKDVYCEMVKGDVIYPHRPDLYDLNFVRCPICGNYTGKYFKHAQYLINSQISDPFLDINSICNTLKISRMKLTKIFNESVGVPPGRYILNRRLALAQSLLTGTDLPISEIAERCGFANSQTFLKFIRRSLGASPLEIREINRQKGSSTVYGKNIQKKYAPHGEEEEGFF